MKVSVKSHESFWILRQFYPFHSAILDNYAYLAVIGFRSEKVMRSSVSSEAHFRLSQS